MKTVAETGLERTIIKNPVAMKLLPIPKKWIAWNDECRDWVAEKIAAYSPKSSQKFADFYKIYVWFTRIVWINEILIRTRANNMNE